MITKYSGNSKPYIYTAFPTNEENSVMRLLQELSDSDVNLWYSDSFDRKEKRRLEKAFGVLLLVDRDFSKSERFHDLVNSAVSFNKNILCVFLESVEFDSWMSMQLGSQLALFRDNYENESDLVTKIKEAQIFQEMTVTDAQKKDQRNRGLTVAIIPVVAAAVLFFTVINPLLIVPTLTKAETIEKMGLTTNDLENVTELYIIGDKIFTNFVHAFYEDNSRQTILYNIETGSGQVREGPIPTGTLTSDELEILKSMPNLKSLTIEGENIDDLSPIFDLDLDVLRLNCNPISSIDGIQKMENLQEISLCFTEIADVSPLYELQKLRHVQIENTYVKDIDGLSALPDLSSLQIGSTYVTNLPQLQAKDNIALGINDLNIKDFSSLKQYNSFSYLQLERLKYNDIAEYIRGKEIYRLEWQEVDVQSLEAFKGFKFSKYSTLNIARSTISSLEGIENIEGVMELSLVNTRYLSDLTPLLNLSTLRKLTLSEDKRNLAQQQLKDANFEISYSDY